MKCHVFRTEKDFRAWIDSVDLKTASFDTETTDLNYLKLDICGFSLCNGGEACYVDLVNNSERNALVGLLYYVMSHKIKALILHNAPFDMKVLYKIGITHTEKIFDTMTAAHLIDDRMNYGLKELAGKFLGAITSSYTNAVKDGFSSETFYRYATNDAIWTWELHKIFNKKIYDFGMDRLFFEVEMPFQFCLRDMEIAGVEVDLEVLEKLRHECALKLFSITKQLMDTCELPYTVQTDMFGGEPVVVSGHNLNSDATILKMFKKFNLEIPFKTDKGNPSVGKETLYYHQGHPFVDLLIKYRIVEKLLNTFIIKIVNFIDSDNRVRCSLNNCGTRTGRLSSSDPNLQQNPNVRKELPIDFRRVFVAPKGKKLIVADYIGQELRVLGVVSNDPTLIKAFEKDMDLHLITANALFNLGLDEQSMINGTPDHTTAKEKYEHERHIGKNGINFPIIYGTTSYGISRNIGVTEAVAQGYIDKFFNTYPEVRKAIKRTSQLLERCYYVRCLSSRRRRLNPKSKKSHRQAFNFLIQGLCADMLRCASIRVRRLILENPQWGLKQLLVVHDEIVMEINEEYVDEALPKIKYEMEHAMRLMIPPKVDLGVGKNYSAAK